MINLRKLYSSQKGKNYITKGDQIMAISAPKGDMSVGTVHDVIEGNKENEDVLVLSVDTTNLEDQETVKQIAAMYGNKVPKYSLMPAATILKIILLESYHGDQKTETTS